ncbi:LysR family transcriptional regulator [Kribbella pratensis]|uniref:DNA-binding transcriptional LysR family regulator n=1 Tax=Kribbella pratensis TaxID=2512112 RepID=A0A4R8C3Q3_9ACTN|nr:LysR family transcriptional regulator [Kribbella pratensis]TDW69721.1 DNA-binding transcriptional LysR family regulator [Kribbella pratensis]
MDPHLLRTFVTVAECGSFSAAAERLGYTQSAVSQHISALENDLGTPLLRRRPVAPTPAGERLLEHAAPILLRLATARADVRRTLAQPPTALTLATTPLATSGTTVNAPPRPGALAVALREVRRAYPGIGVTLTVCGRDEVVEGVAAGTFAVGLVDGVAAPSDPLRLSDALHLRTTPVTHDALIVALSNDHPLAHRRGLSLHDLADARWIDAPDLAAPLPVLRATTGSDGFRPAFTYAGTDLHTLLTLIAAGHGLAVLPSSAPVQTAVPLTSPRLVHRTELLHGDLSEPAALLRSNLK